MNEVDLVSRPIEIWGGVECSLVRINDTIHDQLKMNGHEERLEDLDLFAELGLSMIRYPLLWEKYSYQKEHFFELHDQRLQKLQELNIIPIAGLLHHGSGPFETDMMQPEFPQLLADYAYTIAKRYPWINYYTPVNEPLTTARFSGLYGIWYPHKKDDFHFATIFLNEIKGIILSMARIREINPNAQLIQTEDIAHVHSTRPLKYQANLENERIWLTYDILCGQFDHDHLYWSYFIDIGIPIETLEFFINNPCPPDVCGFNYYVTSERFLDHRIIEYPYDFVGGNDFDDYADIEVVRVNGQKLTGIENLLREASQRYNRPLALTEIHLACTREEQLRWFDNAYKSVLRLKTEGIDIRGITAWSLLGSFDWNSLLQLKNEYYEPGVYDIRSGKPRSTALSHLIKSYTSKQQVENKEHLSTNHELLKVPGWWNRNVRIKYHLPHDLEKLIDHEFNQYNEMRPLIVFGEGAMSIALEKICKLRGLNVIIARNKGSDFYNENEIIAFLDKHKPWAVVNTAGFNKIDEAELSPIRCFRENVHFPKLIAGICLLKNIRMLTFSTDQVFNGKKRQPYIEADLTDPVNIYGMSKKMSEENILSVNPNVLIIRSGLIMDPYSHDDLLYELVFRKNKKQKKYLYSDIIISPAYIIDLINTSLDLLVDKEKGIWHLSGPEAVSYYEFARLAVGIAGVSNNLIYSIPAIRLASQARRPAYSVLRNSSGIILPSLEFSIANYLRDAEKRFSA